MNYLISEGYNIHVDNDLPLCWAAEHGYFNEVKRLIDLGANINAKNNYALKKSIENGG